MEHLDISLKCGRDYRELFSIMIDSLYCEDTAIGVTAEGRVLYIENRLANNSSAYWVDSLFYSITAEEFDAFLNQAKAAGYMEKAIRNGQTSEEELQTLRASAFR